MFKTKSTLISSISLLITIVMMVTLCSVGFTASAGETIDAWDGTAATSFAGGDGSEENPFKIENGGQLYKMVSEYSNTDVGTKPTSHTYFRIIKDINLNGKQWYDIGKTSSISNSNYKTGFSGIIYGDGHKITGLYTNKVAGATGLIPIATQGAEIHDLHLENGDFKKTAWNAYSKGAFIGSAIGSSSSRPIIIEGCSVKNFEIVAKEGAAAFVGYTYSQSFTIENCYCENVDVSITAASGANAGAFLGRTAGNNYGNTIIIRDSHCAEVSPTIYWNSDAFKSITTFTNVYTCNEAYDGSITGVTKLTADQMKGAAAKTNMQGFAWDEVWYTTENGYPTLTAPEAPACQHTTTKDVVTTPATYFTIGLKNVVCADEACGAVVEENVVIERITADPITYEYSYNAKAAALTIEGKFSEALIRDMLATNGAEFTLNYEVAGKTYKAENISVAKEDVGVEIIISGFNKARLGNVKFNLEISWNGAVGAAYTDNAAEFNSKTNGEVDVTTLITGEDKTAYDAFEAAIEAEDEKEIGTTADANNAFMNNSYKVNLAEGSAELKFSINDALRQTLKDNGGHEAEGRVVTFKLKIGDNTYEEVIEELRVNMLVKVTGLSFTHMNSEISAWLEVTYADTDKNFSTADNSVVYNNTQIIENAATAGNGIAAAFKDLMN